MKFSSTCQPLLDSTRICITILYESFEDSSRNFRWLSKEIWRQYSRVFIKLAKKFRNQFKKLSLTVHENLANLHFIKKNLRRLFPNHFIYYLNLILFYLLKIIYNQTHIQFEKINKKCAEFFYKKCKGRTLKITHVTDNRHYGRNNMKELHVWNYKIGLNNWICERNYTKGCFVWNYIGKT